jgi:transcriptional regulator with XRE-family HTH domain
LVNGNKNRIEDQKMLPVQLEMALSALGWGTRDLAAAAQVSLDTIARFKRGEELKGRTVDAMQRALEAAGVVFTDTIGTNGVELAKSARCVADIRTIAVSATSPSEALNLAKGRLARFLAELAEWQQDNPEQDGSKYRALLHDRMLAASAAEPGSKASDLLEEMIDYLADHLDR